MIAFFAAGLARNWSFEVAKDDERTAQDRKHRLKQMSRGARCNDTLGAGTAPAVGMSAGATYRSRLRIGRHRSAKTSGSLVKGSPSFMTAHSVRSGQRSICHMRWVVRNSQRLEASADPSPLEFRLSGRRQFHAPQKPLE